jgi:hypothetical protein
VCIAVLYPYLSIYYVYSDTALLLFTICVYSGFTALLPCCTVSVHATHSFSSRNADVSYEKAMHSLPLEDVDVSCEKAIHFLPLEDFLSKV